MSSHDPWRFQRWAYGQPTGSIGRKAVLLMLATMADSATGRGEVKQDTLAQAVEAGVSTVRGHLKALEDAGLIVRRAQFRIDRGRRGDEFLLLAPWVTEWPDGERLRVQPPESAGGSPSEISYPPSGIEAGGQEQPPRNNHLDVCAPARATTTLWGKVLPIDLVRDATAALEHFAASTGQTLRPFNGSGKATEDLRLICRAMHDYPEVRVMWRRMIDRAVASPWWEGSPSPGVVFSPKKVQGSLAAAHAKPNAGQSRRNGKRSGVSRPEDYDHLFEWTTGRQA